MDRDSRLTKAKGKPPREREQEGEVARRIEESPPGADEIFEGREMAPQQRRIRSNTSQQKQRLQKQLSVG